MQKISNPSKEDVENMHATYINELQKLYDKYNPIYGDVKVRLVFE